LEGHYQKEKRMGKMFALFSGLSIFIAAIGLFGLSAYTASVRTREIGIRKVIGAKIVNIVSILSKDIVKLVMISAFIATPIARFALDKWLSNFAYRIEVSWWFFFVTALATLCIALITISYHTIKAALSNPVNSLKSE